MPGSPRRTTGSAATRWPTSTSGTSSTSATCWRPGPARAGADLLSRRARSVTCVDYDSHCRGAHPRPLPAADRPPGQPDRPALADESVDVIVNFQVIEHLWDQPAFIAECHRVLRPRRAPLMSTPNRITFTPTATPRSTRFHARELNALELTELLVDGDGRAAVSPVDEMLGVHHGPRLLELDAKWDGSIIDAQIQRAPCATSRGQRRWLPTSRRSPPPTSTSAPVMSTPASTCSRSRPDGGAADSVPGQFTLVLHSHLPWLANHGRWPVGEERLYQSWAASYQPVFAVLRRLAADGFSDVASLGITPILAAALDDPHCTSSMYEWLADWQLRAQNWPPTATRCARRRAPRTSRRRCGAGRLRGALAPRRLPGDPQLAVLGVIELLGGPLAHPFAPCSMRLRQFSLAEGLADAIDVGAPPPPASGPRMRLRPRDGDRIRRRRRQPFHGRRSDAARRHCTGPAGRRHRRRRIRARSDRQLPGGPRRAPGHAAYRDSTPTTTIRV